MRLGVFAKTFPGTDAEAVLGAVRAAGYGCAQFNMACVGLPPMPDDIPDGMLERIAAAAARHDVGLVALSATYNMIHPDRAIRAAGQRRLRLMLDAAKALGVPLVTLCTGTCDPDDQWRYHPGNAEPEAWAEMRREIEIALAGAEAAGVDLGIEPEQANVVTSAADARRLIDDLGSPRLKIVLDPANLFERATPDEARRIVAEAVDLCGADIAMAHAKDRHADGRFAAAGTGIVDFPDFVARLAAGGFDGALVTHGLSPGEAPGVAVFLRDLGAS
ncbi:MAG TPA: sugar phosphate isomerase/epimerase family protein [Lichenihabitans sp.]|nr:sugar phosphate isomerase/epimerase family protein [Lichenihabitans sp.]